MIVLILGDNEVASRNKLVEFNRDNFADFEIVKFDTDLDKADFELAIKSQSFFEEKRLMIFENFFKGRVLRWKEEIDFDNLEKSENIFVFWDTTINSLGKKVAVICRRQNIFEFKLPNLLWKFLDDIKPERTGQVSCPYKKNAIDTLRAILKSVDANYLFLMIVRQFRLMIVACGDYRDYPSDYKRLTFQKPRLARQASSFGEERLRKSYLKLLAIEARMKTGETAYDLKTELEKFLVDL